MTRYKEGADLTETPSDLTLNVLDCEGEDALGTRLLAELQAFAEHGEPGLENVFPSYSNLESPRYACQVSSKLDFNENELDCESDQPDTEHVSHKNEEFL